MNNMESVKVGEVVQSIQGHDKGQLYIVIGVNDNRVLLCNGEYKLLKNPKTKNIAHIINLHNQDNEIATKLANGLKINDQMIYHSIVKYKKLIKEN